MSENWWTCRVVLLAIRGRSRVPKLADFGSPDLPTVPVDDCVDEAIQEGSTWHQHSMSRGLLDPEAPAIRLATKPP
jgi:hypothetical protein